MVDDDAISIILTRGHEAWVNKKDAEFIQSFKWHAIGSSRRLYAATKDGSSYVYMHRLIMGEPPHPKAQIDHINMNSLDNRRSNLRWATASTNKANEGKRRGLFTSKFKGVHWNNQKNKWQAEIKANYKKKHLGFYSCEVEAAKAYDRGAVELFGEFAKLNFSKDE